MDSTPKAGSRLIREIAGAVRLGIRNAQLRRTALMAGAGMTLIAAASAQEALDEVVVSASRRDTSVQDIPYSISVVSADTLEQNHVDSLSDLSRQIAGVSFVDEGPTSTSNIVLRGINANGTDHPSTSTVAPVSTYIGETPLFIPLQIDDLNRVEVLRGPQGTLYGSGALAGTLRFIPNDPDLSGIHGRIEGDGAEVAESSQFNRSVKGMFNLPLTDTIAVRISGGYEHYAGFVNELYLIKLGPASTAVNSPVGIPVSADPANPILGPEAFTPDYDANDSTLSHVRASLLFKPNEQFKALLAYYHQSSDAYAIQAISPNFGGSIDYPPGDGANQNPFDTPGYPVSFPTGGVVFPHNSTYDLNDSVLPQTYRHTDLYNADLTYELGFASLSSSTSYYRDSGTDIADNTGLLSLYPSYYGFIPRLVDYELDHDETDGLVQEFRLVSKTGGKLDYVAGLFYQHVQTSSGQLQWIPGQTYFGNLIDEPGANAATLGDLNTIGYTSTDFKDLAGFGELTWHLTDRWQATGGARQFHQSYSLQTATAFTYCGAPCGNDGDQLGTTSSTGGYSVNSHIFKLNTSYKVSDTLNTYAEYSEGFRRGGSNGIPVSGPYAASPSLLVYTPDKTHNYEVGAKGRFGFLNYSAAVFYINWDNFQVDATARASGEPVAINGPRATSTGVELELSGALTRQLTFDLGYSYADAVVAQDFAIMDVAFGSPYAIAAGQKGDPLPNAPKTTATAALDYRQAVPLFSGGWSVHEHVNANFRSATLSQLLSTDPTTPPPFTIHSFTIADASLGLEQGHGLTATAYIQNMFNNLGITGGADAGAVGTRAEHFFVGRPRTVGLRLGYAF